MNLPQTDKSPSLANVGESEPSSDSGADGFSSKWSHILAQPIATSWSDEESERRVEQFTALAWKFWSAGYAYLRCAGCEQATVFHDLRRSLDYLPVWLGREDIAHLRRFRPWLFEALNRYVGFSLHLVSRFGKRIPIAVSPVLCEFEAEVVAALEERPDNDYHFPETLYNRAWTYALDVEAWVELMTRWPLVGEACPLDPLHEFRLKVPTDAECRQLARIVEMAEEEVAMIVSRLHRHFRELLRDKIRDTVTSPEELEEEWAELFPEQASKTRDNNPYSPC